MSEAAGAQPILEPCTGCREMLDVSKFGPFQKVICPHCSVESRVKREFDGYRLERRYAIGGMSVIFVGRDTTLDRQVAIKVLNEEYCNDEIRIKAFENEARLTAQVSHPNVVKVYAVGRAYERFYLVMELLEGQSYEAIMSERGALPEEEVLEIATQVAAGLQAAKSAGMIHRDVKPGNILIDGEGRARLVDFGLALITQDGHAQAEEIWATPYYVPPEALERGIEDFRSDIYAFGATLYHALAGRPPFESTSTSNSVLRRAKQTIPRLCKVAPHVSANTGEAIDRMMAFKPGHRWGSYEDVLKALNRAKRTIGQAPPAPSLVTPRTRQQRRKKGGGFAFIVIAAILGLAAFLALEQPWQKEEKPPLVTPDSFGDDSTSSVLAPTGSPWNSARASVAKGDYSEAGDSLSKLSSRSKLTRINQSWAFFEAAVCAFLDGQAAAGRSNADQAINRLRGLDKNASTVMEIRRLAQLLRKMPPPSNRDFPREAKDLKSAMGTFALALKQWEQGQWEDSLPAFARVRSASLPDESMWFQVYQDLADTYLADAQVLRSLKDLPSPTNAEEASALISRLSDGAKKLRTKGRAIYNLRAQQAYLARLRKSFSTKPDEPELTDWQALLPALAQHGRDFEFSAIAENLSSPPSGTPADALWSWQFLQKGASTFISELNAKDNWAAQKTDGNPVTPETSNAEGLTLEDGTLVPWKEINPKSLIVVHTGEKANAVAFAWLTGLTEKAEEMAEELAGQDSKFRDNWKRVLIGTSL